MAVMFQGLFRFANGISIRFAKRTESEMEWTASLVHVFYEAVLCGRFAGTAASSVRTSGGLSVIYFCPKSELLSSHWPSRV